MIIGLTGGIASGKSTLSTFFEQKGCFVIDADKIAHEVTGKNSEGANKIKQAFGEEFFDNGVLNRKKLAEHVFASADKTKVLILPFPNNPTGAIMEKEDIQNYLIIVLMILNLMLLLVHLQVKYLDYLLMLLQLQLFAFVHLIID